MGSRLPSQLVLSAARTCRNLQHAAAVTFATPASKRTAKWSLWNRDGGNRDRSQKLSGILGEEETRKLWDESLRGGLQGSIFDDQPRPAGEAPASESGALASLSRQQPEESTSDLVGSHDSRPATANDLTTCPDPRATVRWKRKKVMQLVRRGSRPATRAERIARSERVMTFKSPWMATGVKKLGMLARQISGKTIDDALVQMRFSKKKYAREIAYNLREARDLATVKYGMGLEWRTEAVQEALDEIGSVPRMDKLRDRGGAMDRAAANLRAAREEAGKQWPKRIQTKEGKWTKITDPTRMYIDQAWVNRGPFRPKQIDYKGRGRCGIIRPPSTSISFLLKEEVTRARIFAEKKAREAKKAPWVHLPDRPIMGQRPYYSW